MAEQIISKRCSKCKEIKPFSEFNKDKTKKDGNTSRCKSCRIDDHKQYYKANKEKEIERSKKYQKTEKGKINHQEARFRYNKSDKGKKKNRKASSHYRFNNPEKFNARDFVNKAIGKGDIPRPSLLKCHYYTQNSDCEKQAKQYHHYLGYEPEHWLDIVPVCRNCHIKYEN